MSKYPSERPSLKFFLTELPIFTDELWDLDSPRQKKKPFPKKWLSMIFFNPEA